MNKDKMTEYIKVNFPLTAEAFTNGNGEGMWVLVDPETKEAHDADAVGGSYVGILDNDSVYFPGLNHGEVVRFEMRGTCRPVAFFDGFLAERIRLTQEGKELCIRQIAEQQAQALEPPICCDCQFCGDRYSFPEPNDLIEMNPENPLLKHFYCCCGDCDLYGNDITGLGIHECEHFNEL